MKGRGPIPTFNDTTFMVLDVINDHRRLTSWEIRHAIDMSKHASSYHVSILYRTGCIDREISLKDLSRGKHTYFLTQKGELLLHTRKVYESACKRIMGDAD